MRKKIAPLAVLFGLLGALMVGGASTASASDGKYHCHQSQGSSKNLVNVSCSLNNIANNVTINILNVKALNNNQISILENNLNNTNLLNVNVEDVEAVVIKTFKSFNIEVSDNQVKVCNINILSIKKVEVCT